LVVFNLTPSAGSVDLDLVRKTPCSGQKDASCQDRHRGDKEQPGKSDQEVFTTLIPADFLAAICSTIV